MKKALSMAVLGIALLGSATVSATDNRPAHFKGVASPDLVTALSNLAEYNQRLADLLKNEQLTPEDMNAVHQLTYTLENALQRIEKEVEDMAETLERVHIASETAKPEVVQTEGDKYLKAATVITQGVK